MTPSEIADLEFKLKAALFQIEACDEQIERQAATIRAQAEALDKHIESHKETLGRERVLLDKLKIATEALEKMVALYENDLDPENLARPKWLVDALARIKEVGE